MRGLVRKRGMGGEREEIEMVGKRRKEMVRKSGRGGEREGGAEKRGEWRKERWKGKGKRYIYIMYKPEMLGQFLFIMQ